MFLREKDGVKEEVNLNQPVMLDGKVGIFESTYENRMNIRTEDGQLHTVQRDKVQLAPPEKTKNVKAPSAEREELLSQARAIKEALKVHGLMLKVDHMNEGERKEYAQEQANISKFGHAMTDEKKMQIKAEEDRRQDILKQAASKSQNDPLTSGQLDKSISPAVAQGPGEKRPDNQSNK